jgi:hypothetical protein
MHERLVTVMNKICIVRRRQKRIQEIEEKTDFISDTKTVSAPWSYRGVGEGRHVTVDIQGNEGTHVILKINYDSPKAGALLKADDVCDMLQVSKGFVAKLVRTRAVQSYKIGSPRWFALEEILHYLSRNKRVASS